MRQQSYNVISDHITDDIPPQMNILNMVIPILMHLLHLFVKGIAFCTKLKLRKQRKTTTSTNHKRRHL